MTKRLTSPLKKSKKFRGKEKVNKSLNNSSTSERNLLISLKIVTKKDKNLS